MSNPPRTMVAIVTPFDEAGGLDLDAYRSVVSDIAAEGCNGFVVAGSTGEGPYLEPGERRALVAATRERSPDSYILCGVNAESIRQAQRQVDEAADGGADAVLVITPTTLVRSKDALVADFYTTLADASPVPVWLYSVPKVTGYGLPIEVAEHLAPHGNIAGIKDSSGILERIESLAPIDDLLVYCGASAIVKKAVETGADGAITASANYVYAQVDAAVGGDEAAQTIVRDVTSVVEPNGVPGTKAAASLAGRRVGSPRAPLNALEPDATARIRDVLAATVS